MTNINTFQGDVFIHEYIKHSGDDNNLFGFSGTDTFKIATAGVDAIKVDASQNVDITGVIRHIGDENNLFGFSGTDTFKIATGGTDRLTVSSAGNVTLSNKLYIPSYIYHAGGDNNTYFGFSGDDTIVMRVNGGNRLTVNSSGTVTLSQGLGASVTPGDYITGSAYNGATARTFAVDATTAATAGKVAARDGSADIQARLFRSNYTNQSTISGAMAYRVNNSSDNHIRFCSDAAAIRTFIGCLASNGTAATATKVQVTRDDTGDTANYLTMVGSNTAGQRDLYMDANLIYDNTNNRLRLKQVMFGDQNVYGLGAVAGDYGSVGTVGTGKGSWEGYSINGQWVFMSEGASFCGIYNDTDNEWAAKFNQNGSTDLYYNNSNKLQTTNTGVHVTGTLSADHMYIDDYLYHNGDNNTYIGFSAVDTIVMRTSGTNRLTISSAGLMTSSGTTRLSGNTAVGAAVDTAIRFYIQGNINAHDTFYSYSRNDSNSGYYSYFKQRGIDFSASDPLFLFKMGEYNEGQGNTQPGFEVEGKNGTKFFAVRQNGKVGIGTSSPEAKLHVKGGSICVHRTFPDTPSAGIVFMEDHSDKDCMFIAYDASGTAETSDERLSFYSKAAGGADPTISGANLLMCMRADGNVGIGTTSPEYKLHIEDSTNPRILLENTDTVLGLDQDIGSIIFKQNDNTSTGTGIIGKIRMSSVIAPPAGTFYGESANMIFSVGNYANNNANNDALTIRGNGNVGIGTTSPSTLLHLQSKTGDPLATEGDLIGAHNLTEYLRFTGQGDVGDINSVSVGFKLGADDNSVVVPYGRLDICVNGAANGNNGYGTIPDKTIATFLGSGNVGIGTSAPASTMHIYKDANEQTTGLIIEKENAGTGAAAIFFAVSSANSPEPASLAKGAILFQRESTYGRGSLKLCVDTVGDTNAVTSTESALTINYQGFVQPGQINLTKPLALGGNYLFQGIYNAYRTNGYASTTWSTVYEKHLQVVRMGSLLSIRGNLPLKLTSSTMNLQFTWAEVGCDGQRGGLSTLVNQCTSTTGTWNTVTGNATYLILPSTGHAGNNTVDYNDIVYLIDLGYITAY